MKSGKSTSKPDSSTPVTMRLLGTAGHIDHGKSSLIKALTGVDPDRLPEERRRGMTIELGFAHLDVPTGGGVVRFGIVDVPGHERFVRTMVAGATGIDVALLVVAADDGWMPQTQEHVEILDLLGVSHGVVAITKADAAAAERVAQVERDVRARLAKTALENWPLVATSAKTGDGLNELRDALAAAASNAPAGRKHSVFRLAIDRVFALKGRGTIVTGSVMSGHVRPGDALELLPGGAACRVREVQNHGELVEDAVGGQRAAINMTGIDRETIERGMELATPGHLAASRYVDASVRVLPRFERGVRSHQKVRLLLGTTEAMATLVVIGADAIAAGASAPVQLRAHRPVVAAFGQRFILRDETATATIGGGAVVRPQARRVRPKHRETAAAFELAASGAPAVRLGAALRELGFEAASAERLSTQIGIEPGEVAPLVESIAASGELVEFGGRRVHRDVLQQVLDRAAAMLERHHAARPNEPGLQRDRLVGWIGARSAPGLGKALLRELESRGLVSARGPYVAHRDFRPAMSAEDAALLGAVVAEIEAAGFDPPAWEKLHALRTVSRQKSKSLADLAKTDPRLVSYAPGQFATAGTIERFRAVVAALGAGGRRFKLADVRDQTGQSRRVVQPLLEHLDRVGFTKRVGDERVLV